MKKIVSILLVVCMLAGFSGALAIDAGQERAVIGANLNEDQINSVYKTFGIERGSVTELKVTNAEERAYLEGIIPSSEIGTNSISCVYIKTLEEGSGLDVTANNTDFCSRETYVNALVTAGITDAQVIVAAPITVSGTAALTGVYKAYESITGQTLDEVAKEVGAEELVITSSLAQELGEYDASLIVNELKQILDETENMTDEELKVEIKNIAIEFNVTITDAQIDQLIKLCRQFERLDTSALMDRVEGIQNTIKNFANVQETTGKFVTGVKNFFSAIGNFFSGLFGKK